MSDGKMQEFISERLAEQKASLEAGAAALKTECEEIMADIRSDRCDLTRTPTSKLLS